jgi:hypothetical protein
MQIGCIDGRQLAVLITVHNRTSHTVTLLSGGGPQRASRVIDRVAAQVRLAPPPPRGDVAVSGLRSWSRHDSGPASIPAGRDAWVQSDFLMRNCRSLRAGEVLTANRSITLSYRAGGYTGTQSVPVKAARIMLSRGPVYPSVPINQTG